MSLGLPTAPGYTPLTATIPPQEGESGSPHCTCVHATHCNYSTTGRRVWVSPLHLRTRHSLQLFHHRKASLDLPTAPGYTPLTATIPPQEGESGSPHCTCVHATHCNYSTTGRRVWISPLHLGTRHSLQLFHHRKASLGLPTAPAYTPLTATIPPQEGESGSPHCTCVHATHCNYSTTGRRVWVSPLHLRTRHSLQLFHHRKASLGLPTAPAYTPLTATIPPQEGESGSPHCTCVHATHCNYSTTGRRVWVSPLHLRTRHSLQLFHHRKASLDLPTAPGYTPLTATIPPQEGESGSPHCTCVHATHCNYSTTGRRVWISPLHLGTRHSLQLFHHRKASLGLPTAPAYTPLTATIPPQEGESGSPHCTCVHATHCNYSTTGRRVWVSPLHLRTRHSLQLFHHRKASLGLPTAPAYTPLTATIPPQEGESGSPHCTCVHATHCNYSTTGRRVWVSPLHLLTRHSLQLFHHRKASLGLPTAPAYTPLTATIPPQEGESGSPHCTCVHATHCNYSTTGRRVWVSPLHLRTRHSLQLFHHRKASLGLPTAPAYTPLTATIPPQEGESGSPHCTCVHATHCNYSTTGR